VGRRSNPPGAKLDGHQLHDELQRASGELSNRLCHSQRGANDDCFNDEQRVGEHGMHPELRQHTGHVSDELRPLIALTIRDFRIPR
jgi:hypothetical protein